MAVINGTNKSSLDRVLSNQLPKLDTPKFDVKIGAQPAQISSSNMSLANFTSSSWSGATTANTARPFSVNPQPGAIAFATNNPVVKNPIL